MIRARECIRVMARGNNESLSKYKGKGEEVKGYAKGYGCGLE